MPTNDRTQVVGPDNRTYYFPPNTTKEQAIAYFKRKGIGVSAPEASNPYVAAAARLPADSGTSMGPAAKTYDQTHPDPNASAFHRFMSSLGLPTSQGETTEMVRGMLTPEASPTSPGFGQTLPIVGPVFRAQRELYESKDPQDRIRKFIPVLGPVDSKMQKQLDKGDIAGAAGSGLNIIGTMVGAKEMFERPKPRPLYTQLAEETLSKVMRPGVEKRLNQLTKVLGETGEHADVLEKSIGELQNQVKLNGKEPATPKEFLELVTDAERRLNRDYAYHLQQVAGQEIVPTKVADALRAKADSMSTSTEGKAAAQEIRQMQSDYERPRSIRDLDAERMERNALADSLYNKGLGGQIAAQQKAAAAAVNKLIADTIRDVIYDDVLGSKFPEADLRGLKLRQKSLIDLKETLETRVPELKTGQRAAEGTLLRERLSTTGYAGGHGIRPLVHAGPKLFPRWRGPGVVAERLTTKAFKGLGDENLGRYAVKARANGQNAVADVLDDLAGRTPTQKAKDAVRHIETDVDEITRRGPGQRPPDAVDAKTRAAVEERLKQARQRTGKASGASAGAGGGSASPESAGGSGEKFGGLSDAEDESDIQTAKRTLGPNATPSQILLEAQRLKDLRLKGGK